MTASASNRWARDFLAGWGMMDANAHLANTAYLNLAADARMACFADHGFSPAEFVRLAIGPVIRKDELEYFREVGLHEQVTVTCAVLALSFEGSRFVIENGIWRAGGERAAVVRSTGGWLDLRTRALVAPPPSLLEVLRRFPRDESFAELPPPRSKPAGSNARGSTPK